MIPPSKRNFSPKLTKTKKEKSFLLQSLTNESLNWNEMRRNMTRFSSVMLIMNNKCVKSSHVFNKVRLILINFSNKMETLPSNTNSSTYLSKRLLTDSGFGSCRSFNDLEPSVQLRKTVPAPLKMLCLNFPSLDESVSRS